MFRKADRERLELLYNQMEDTHSRTIRHLEIYKRFEAIEQSQGKLLAAIDEHEDRERRRSVELHAKLDGLSKQLVDEIRQCFLAGQITKAVNRKRKRK